MLMRSVLSALALVAAGMFAVPGGASAKPARDYVVTKKAKKVKKAKRVRSRYVRQRTARAGQKRRKSAYGRKNVRYKKRKKVTIASLNVKGIKNLRHAKLTRAGRMSVAKDTRRSTVRNFARRVSYKYRPGTVVLSNYTRRLYYVVRPGKVISYPIAIPRPDEIWSGSTKITKKKINPDWYPTPSMREKDPSLPVKVPGGHPSNPFGKRALYLGQSIYRIHGTNSPRSIGRSASSGCYRMRNSDIRKLWRLVGVGTPVVVLTGRKI